MWKPGDKVICNGNPEGVVLGEYAEGMYEVRLWQGSRVVGVVCVAGSELKAAKEESK